MAHDCPDCGDLCYCDLEDVMFEEAPVDCLHCIDADNDDDEDDFEEAV